MFMFKIKNESYNTVYQNIVISSWKNNLNDNFNLRPLPHLIHLLEVFERRNDKTT